MTTPALPQYLTSVVKQVTQAGSTISVTEVSAQYDATGDLTSLTNSLSSTASLSTGGFSGSSASQSSSDPSGGDTESIYDTYGNVTRSIQTEKDASGDVLGYLVTVTDYGYSPSDVSQQLNNIFQYVSDGNVQPGNAYSNELQSVKQYQSFFVSGTDLVGRGTLKRRLCSPKRPITRLAT